MTKSTLTLFAATLLALGLAGTAFTQEHKNDEHKAAAKAITITAHVVDSNCYIVHNGIGPQHATCAETCAKKGIPLALLDTKANVLYLALAAHHENANPLLMAFIEKDVKVTGVVAEKNGMKTFVVTKVEAAP